MVFLWRTGGVLTIGPFVDPLLVPYAQGIFLIGLATAFLLVREAKTPLRSPR
jgi:hypothetical protein